MVSDPDGPEPARCSVKRVAKTICTVNFLLSILLFGGYIVHGISNGLDFNHEFLGIVHGNHGKAAWPVLTYLEVQLFIVFVVQRISENPETLRRRIIYILSGLVGLLLTAAAGSTQGNYSPDFLLGVYIWASDIAYGLLGGGECDP